MKVHEALEQMRRGQPVPAGSPGHRVMHELAQEALKITAELNGSYHSPEEIRALFSRLTGRPAGEGFSLFPPFHTDCGKNIIVGKNVFINACCCFQDQGGITIGDGVLIGHEVVLATITVFLPVSEGIITRLLS